MFEGRLKKGLEPTKTEQNLLKGLPKNRSNFFSMDSWGKSEPSKWPFIGVLGRAQTNGK